MMHPGMHTSTKAELLALYIQTREVVQESPAMDFPLTMPSLQGRGIVKASQTCLWDVPHYQGP